MSQPNDLSRSLTSLEQDSTIIAVIETSQSSWLVAGIVPGIERHPLKKIEPSEEELICLLMRWRSEATKHGRTITRIAVAFEAGRDGFWLARWLRARGIEIYVIHPTSVAVSREHRRAKTDRLDTGLLKRVFIGWLRGEPDHCHMAAIPTLAEEDAKRPNRERERLVRERTRIVNRMKSCLVRFGVRNFKPTLRKAPERLETLQTPEGVPLPPNTLLELRRDMARLRFVMDQIKQVEEARAQRLEQAPQEKSHAMVRLLARVIGVGIETADMLVHEVLARNLRDRRAVARYAGLTGAPDESGSRRREKGLARTRQARSWRTRNRRYPVTIRGGGHPKQAMVLAPVSRMGPRPRSFAADAHDCIMVRSRWTYRIQGCGAMIRARWQAPLGPFRCPAFARLQSPPGS